MRRIAALLVLFSVAVTLTALDVGETVGISVRETDLRSTSGFLSRTVATLLYLDEVKILSERNDWYEVEVIDTGQKGWIHSSSVSEPKELELAGGSSSRSSGASNREIALAGRGFNEQVEEQIKADENLDFSLVDEMEGYILEPSVAAEFLVAAGLEPEEGGAE